MIREIIVKLIEKAIKDLQKEKKLPGFKIPEISVESSKEKSYGDYFLNIALKLAKIVKKSPREIAENLKSQILNLKSDFFEKIEAVGGFINFFVSKKYLQNQVGEILKQKEKFGNLKIGKNQKVNVEFISANPTGPLTLGNGRGGFCGDVLAKALEKAGYQTKKEYYINDTGEQIKKLGHSVLGDSQAVYAGKYINTLRESIRSKEAEKAGEEAAKIILEEMIKPTVKRMGIEFDFWFSEKSLYQKKEIDKVFTGLKKKKLTYESEGALWFKSTQFGDDKDRVLVKSDGEKTYFTSDIAYLKNKFKRGFKKLIFFWGADHFGYINRLKAAAEALGYKKEQLDIIVMQMVQLFQKGEEVKMSKRGGIYLTIDELIDEVGLDIVRFFFLTRGPGSHLIFDLDLAKEQSEKNPVYYVQYAYTRIHSILAKSKIKIQNSKLKFKIQNFKLLTHKSELNLIKQLIRFPEIIEDTAKDYQVQRIPQYAADLATAFHQFYGDCRVVNEDKNLSQARLGLILATKIVLKNTFDLMGISTPEKM